MLDLYKSRNSRWYILLDLHVDYAKEQNHENFNLHVLSEFCAAGNITLLLFLRALLITVGDRAFAVAGIRLWNSLLHFTASAPTLGVFRKRFKTYLFFSFVLTLAVAHLTIHSSVV